MINRRNMLCLFLLTLVSTVCAAAELPTYVILRAGSPITVDGRLDEAAWQAADDVGDFRFAWYKDGEQEQTSAKLLWDDTYLYASFVCTDAHISGKNTERDSAVYKDDCVEVFTAPNPDRPNDYFNFEMNVVKGLLDRHQPEGPGSGRKLSNWNAKGIKIAVTIAGTLNDNSDRDQHWILEAAIPLANFQGVAKHVPPHSGDVWRLNLNRLGGATNPQFSQWSPSATEKPNFHFPASFGRVVFSDTESTAKPRRQFIRNRLRLRR